MWLCLFWRSWSLHNLISDTINLHSWFIWLLDEHLNIHYTHAKILTGMWIWWPFPEVMGLYRWSSWTRFYPNRNIPWSLRGFSWPKRWKSPKLTYCCIILWILRIFSYGILLCEKREMPYLAWIWEVFLFIFIILPLLLILVLYILRMCHLIIPCHPWRYYPWQISPLCMGIYLTLSNEDPISVCTRSLAHSTTVQSKAWAHFQHYTHISSLMIGGKVFSIFLPIWYMNKWLATMIVEKTSPNWVKDMHSMFVGHFLLNYVTVKWRSALVGGLVKFEWKWTRGKVRGFVKSGSILVGGPVKSGQRRTKEKGRGLDKRLVWPECNGLTFYLI